MSRQRAACALKCRVRRAVLKTHHSRIRRARVSICDSAAARASVAAFSTAADTCNAAASGEMIVSASAGKEGEQVIQTVGQRADAPRCAQLAAGTSRRQRYPRQREPSQVKAAPAPATWRRHQMPMPMRQLQRSCWTETMAACPHPHSGVRRRLLQMEMERSLTQAARVQSGHAGSASFRRSLATAARRRSTSG